MKHKLPYNNNNTPRSSSSQHSGLTSRQNQIATPAQPARVLDGDDDDEPTKPTNQFTALLWLQIATCMMFWAVGVFFLTYGATSSAWVARLYLLYD